MMSGLSFLWLLARLFQLVTDTLTHPKQVGGWAVQLVWPKHSDLSSNLNCIRTPLPLSVQPKSTGCLTSQAAAIGEKEGRQPAFTPPERTQSRGRVRPP